MRSFAAAGWFGRLGLSRRNGRWPHCWPCWRELRYRAEKPPTIVISPLNTALLLQAISLVHPDKHPAERAALCNRVTAALVEALTAIREAA